MLLFQDLIARIFCGGAGTNTSTSAAICRTRKIQKNRATTDALEKRRVRVRNLCAPERSLNGGCRAAGAGHSPLQLPLSRTRYPPSINAVSLSGALH